MQISHLTAGPDESRDTSGRRPLSNMTSFGAWLRQQRRSRDLTQVELAKLVGCSVGTLRNIETDTARPSKQLAALLATTFGVADADVAALVALARRSRQPSADEQPVPPGAPNLTSQKAPLQSRRLNLPAQLTGLIGRTHEVDAVCALLLRPDVRLVTLTGPGGTGKTRVAMQVAAQVLDAFPDGVVFVDLAALTDSDLVLGTIVQTLGVTEGGEQTFSKQLAAVLRDQSLLLLLDNFEQVVAAAPAVTRLLTACPNLKVLITSRITPEMTGEYEWPIPPLALPDRSPLPPIEQLIEYESVRLFSERARAVNPQFAVIMSNAQAVAEICHRLDGLPLAIELAAARVKLFQPQALLARLNNRLTVLTGGGRDRPTRQQTMLNTIAWSYQLLSLNEQRLFERLSVFVGGATLAAITAVCGDGETEVELVNSVAALVNHSLLRRLRPSPESVTGDIDERFGMLETIREYGLAKLFEQGVAEDLHGTHARYYLTVAEKAMAEWGVSTAHAAVEQIKGELNNMRAALQWSHDNGDPLVGLQLAGVLWRFWRTEGFISEGRTWLKELLALNALPHDADAPASATVSARLLGTVAAAWLASDQHDYEHAKQLLDQSMIWRHSLEETEAETHLLHTAALQAHVLETHLLHTAALEARTVGDYQRATILSEDALARGRALNAGGSIHSLYDMGYSLYGLALMLREQGNFARAITLFEECIAFHRQVGDREGVAQGLLGLSDIARDQGNVWQIRKYTEESLTIYREFGTQWAIGFALNNLAQAAYVARDLPQAFALASESVTMFRAQNADASLAEALVTLGYVLRAQRDVTAAYTASVEALRITLVVGPRLMMATTLECLASVMMDMRQAVPAVRLLAGAAVLREQMGTPVRPIDQPVMIDTLATTRLTLGEDVFAALWEESASLPLEQLLNIVLAT